MEASFRFKQFGVSDAHCGMKVCSDSVLLGAWACEAGAEWGRVLDLGAGSALLSLMAAQRLPQAQIVALEIDPDACLDAQANIGASPWARRIAVACADAMAYEPDAKPDLILCNPPYFTSTLISPNASRAKARHGAVDAASLGQNPLNPASAISLAAGWLAPDGALAMVTPAEGYSDLLFQAEMSRLRLRRICRVSPVEGRKPNRLLWLLSRRDGPVQEEALAIKTLAGAYSYEYKRLTSDFYLNF